MKRMMQYTAGGVAGMALLSLALISGQVSLPTSHASSDALQTAAPAAQPVALPPAEGFTGIAKAVTPAVVNITAAMTEKISDMPDSRDRDFRDRMEEFFGMPGDPFGSRKHRGPRMPREPRQDRKSVV